MSAESFDSWAILELMGHVKMAGRVSEEERFGSKLGRIDVPTDGDAFVTVYFGASSVYRLTVVSEEAARAVARGNKPRPVHQWELPKPEMRPESEEYADMMDARADRYDDDRDDDEEEDDPL
jgi:hypothetical protein